LKANQAENYRKLRHIIAQLSELPHTWVRPTDVVCQAALYLAGQNTDGIPPKIIYLERCGINKFITEIDSNWSFNDACVVHGYYIVADNGCYTEVALAPIAIMPGDELELTGTVEFFKDEII
jgi:hypothetical protein